MKKSRFTDAQILGVLKQGENGVAVADLCREHGISNATYYNWRSKFGGRDASLMSEMKGDGGGEPAVEENVRRDGDAERASERRPRKRLRGRPDAGRWPCKRLKKAA